MLIFTYNFRKNYCPKWFKVSLSAVHGNAAWTSYGISPKHHDHNKIPSIRMVLSQISKIFQLQWTAQTKHTLWNWKKVNLRCTLMRCSVVTTMQNNRFMCHKEHKLKQSTTRNH